MGIDLLCADQLCGLAIKLLITQKITYHANFAHNHFTLAWHPVAC